MLNVNQDVGFQPAVGGAQAASAPPPASPIPLAPVLSAASFLHRGHPAVRSIVDAGPARLVTSGRVAIGEPKTAAGVRTVHLADDALQVLAHRLEVLAGEVQRAVHVGRWAGPDDPWIFGTHLGRPTNPSELLRAFARLVTAAGVPRIRFHDLRHTYASLALRSGVPLPAVSLRLGHSSPTITSEIYAHVVPGDERTSALSLAELGATRGPAPTAGSCTVAVTRPSDRDSAVN